MASPSRARKKIWRSDRAHGDLTDAAPDAWQEHLDQHIFKGSRILNEVTFFHRRRRALILADLIENPEPSRLPRFYAFLLGVSGASDPDGKLPTDLRLGFLGR